MSCGESGGDDKKTGSGSHSEHPRDDRHSWHDEKTGLNTVIDIRKDGSSKMFWGFSQDGFEPTMHRFGSPPPDGKGFGKNGEGVRPYAHSDHDASGKPTRVPRPRNS